MASSRARAWPCLLTWQGLILWRFSCRWSSCCMYCGACRWNCMEIPLAPLLLRDIAATLECLVHSDVANQWLLRARPCAILSAMRVANFFLSFSLFESSAVCAWRSEVPCSDIAEAGRSKKWAAPFGQPIRGRAHDNFGKVFTL